MTSKPKVINFFAGPGAGKSTLAAGLFAELKFRRPSKKPGPKTRAKKAPGKVWYPVLRSSLQPGHRVATDTSHPDTTRVGHQRGLAYV